MNCSLCFEEFEMTRTGIILAVPKYGICKSCWDVIVREISNRIKIIPKGE